MSISPSPLQPIQKLPYRVSGQLEATGQGGFRLLCFGTSWRFKIIVSVGQIIQLWPGQTVTVVGLEDSTTLLVEL
jgi:hypothetical protein